MQSQVQKHGHELRQGWCTKAKNWSGRQKKACTTKQAQMQDMTRRPAIAELTSPILCRSFKASLMTSKCLSCSFVSRRTSSRSCSTQQPKSNLCQHANVSCSHALRAHQGPGKTGKQAALRRLLNLMACDVV